jgi:hypothetical protein
MEERIPNKTGRNLAKEKIEETTNKEKHLGIQ